MDCKLPSTVSNEKVIEELTTDLEKSCIKTYDDLENEKYLNVNNENDEKEIDFKNSESKQESEVKEVTSDVQEDEYFVDDIILKDRDFNLTEEEKQTFKSESESLKNRGNILFGEGNYVDATAIYTKALKICPLIFKKERAILYANRAASKDKFMSDKSSAITDCTKAIELDENYIKAYLRRARFLEECDKLDEAVADYKKVLNLDPTRTEAIQATKRLEPIIHERNEKLKDEMLSKLKDLGNMILKPFGLSTNNFEMQKDEATGGYSVKFNQNPS